MPIDWGRIDEILYVDPFILIDRAREVLPFASPRRPLVIESEAFNKLFQTDEISKGTQLAVLALVQRSCLELAPEEPGITQIQITNEFGVGPWRVSLMKRLKRLQHLYPATRRWILTDNIEFTAAVVQNNLAVFPLGSLQGGNPPDPEVLKIVSEYLDGHDRRSEKAILMTGVALGVLGTAIIAGLIYYRDFITERWSWSIVPFAALILGVVAFFFRVHYRAIYGWFEIGVGVASAVFASLQYSSAIAKLEEAVKAAHLAKIDPPSSLMANAAIWFQFLASLYIIVRGIDNVGVAGISQMPKWLRKFWVRFLIKKESKS